jgi:hypothetical protein
MTALLHVRAAALVIASVALPCIAFGQSTLSLSAGAAVPSANPGNPLSTGYTAALGIGGKPPQARIGLRIEGMFSSMALSDSAAGDASKRILAASLNGTFSTSGRTAPLLYLIGGLGIYSTKLNGVSPAQKANSDAGFNLGLGSNLPGTGFSTFLEVRYHHVPTEGGTLSFIPITFGIRL